MIEFLIYNAKVAVLIAVFYMFYRLLLAHETFHRVNRIVLLSTAALSFILPLCIITTHHTVIVQMAAPTTSGATAAAAAIQEIPLWQTLIITTFFIGMILTIGNTILSIVKVCRLIAKCEKHKQEDGITIAICDSDIAPFSFLHYIVLNRKDFTEQDAAILAHERAHVRLHHSADVLTTDIITALQWFNPAIWMLRADLRAIHEYEADAAVLSQNINARQYQYLLIKKAAGSGGYSIANSFNHSTLKNRITMMLCRKSANTRMLKLLFALPIIGVTVALNAKTVNDYQFAGTQKTEQKAVEENKSDMKAVNVTQQMPSVTADVKDEANTENVAQKKKIKVEGTVVDEKGEPIVGAIVMGQDKKHGTVTDDKGNFIIAEAEESSPLQVQYVDYRTEVVAASPNMKVVLKNDGSAVKKESKLEDVDIFINDVKASKAEMDKLNPNDIESITVNKKQDNGAKKSIRIFTKKK